MAILSSLRNERASAEFDLLSVSVLEEEGAPDALYARSADQRPHLTSDLGARSGGETSPRSGSRLLSLSLSP